MLVTGLIRLTNTKEFNIQYSLIKRVQITRRPARSRYMTVKAFGRAREATIGHFSTTNIVLVARTGGMTD